MNRLLAYGIALLLLAGVAIYVLANLGSKSSETAASDSQADTGIPASEVRGASTASTNLGPFKKLRVSGAFKVVLSQAKEGDASYTLEASEKLREKIEIFVEGDELVVRMKSGISWSWGSNDNPKLYLEDGQVLEEIRLSGATKLETAGTYKSGDLKVSGSGASDLTMQLESKALTFDMSGSSELDLSGSATSFEAEVNGASDVDASQLVVATAEVSCTGASEMKLNVSESLEVDASGASSVRYSGSPKKVDVKSSGASSVKPS